MHRKTPGGKFMGAVIIALAIQATILSFNFLVRAQDAPGRQGSGEPNITISQPAQLANSGEKAARRNLYQRKGKATHYSNRFHNKKTASGERYNKGLYTAAHKSLPFGTILRVTNTSTNRSVLVRINDRGPFRSANIIDLSLASALEIGLKGSPSVEIEGFIPGSLDLAECGQEKYLMGFSESDSPILLAADKVELQDSVENFQDAVEIYKDMVSADSRANHYIFVHASVFDDNNLRGDKITYYIGSEKKRMAGNSAPKSLVRNQP